MKFIRFLAIFQLLLILTGSYQTGQASDTLDCLNQILRSKTRVAIDADAYSQIVTPIKEQYLKKQLIQHESNVKFHRLAFLSNRGKLFYDVENAILKQLNDHVIRDKDLVTALNNRYKSKILEMVKNDSVLGKSLIGEYSDYKSLRLAFSKNTPEIKVRLQRIHEQAANNFNDYLTGHGVEKIFNVKRVMEGDPKNWFHAGVSQDPRLANKFAHFNRKRFAPGTVTPILDNENFVKKIIDYHKKAESLRDMIQKKLLSKDHKQMFFMKTSQKDKFVLSEDAAEIFRKIQATDQKEYVFQVKEKIKNRFAMEISDNEVIIMRDYFHLCDDFSPEVYELNPQAGYFPKKFKGLFSVDFVGQGATNASQNMASLAVAPQGDIYQLIKHTQKGFDKATTQLKQLKQSFNEIAESIEKNPQLSFSGDDGLFYPKKSLTISNFENIVRKLGQTDQPGKFRTVYLPPKYPNTSKTIPMDLRRVIIEDAEKLEKSSRSLMEKNIELDKLKDITIAFRVEPLDLTQVKIHANIAGKKLSDSELQEVREKILLKISEDNQLRKVQFVPGDIKFLD